MAHLNSSYDSFETFLSPADDAAWTLTGTWTVDLNALNSSGVSGSVVLAMSSEEDGTHILNVSVAAEGLTPNQGHAQHIHGLFDGDGTPIDSTAPTIADDADRDGIVEVLEGVGRYGDVILSLVNGTDRFPFADQNGQTTFIANYDLSDETNFVSPVTQTQYDMEDLMPLFLREVVLHGIDVPDGIGAGTSGEVSGDNGYIGIVPAAAGDIETASVIEALEVLGAQRAIASDNLQATDAMPNVFGGLGEDTISGTAGDNELFGGADDDQVFGFDGNDVVGGGTGDDLVGGGGWADTVYGGAGDDTVFGAAGADDVSGGAGDDRVFGGGGNDSLYGGAGDDVVVGGAGNDAMYGGLGSDAVSGGAGDDAIFAGPDDNAENDADDGASGALALADYDNGYAGGAGDDTINGGAGDDIITGDDDSRVSTAANDGFDENADGSDVIFGGAGNDEIHTGTWADSDDGFNNTQTGTANDFASGGDGNDIIRGAGGDDFLRGDAGDDNIGGGGGADVFLHSGEVSDGSDTLIDYSFDEDDVLRITANAGEDDFTFVRSLDGGGGDAGVEDLFVSLDGDLLFTLLDYDDAGVRVSTGMEDFTYDVL